MGRVEDTQAAPLVICAQRRYVRRWVEPLPEVLPQTSALPGAITAPPAAKVRLPVVKFVPPPRPRIWGDCLPGGHNAQRPCPWVSCRHHLMLLVDGEKVRMMADSPEKLPHSCSLDVAELADDGREMLLRQLEVYFGVTRERVRQLEHRAVRELLAGLTTGGGYEPEEIERMLAGALTKRG